MARQNKSQPVRLGGSYLNFVVGVLVIIALASIIVGLIRSKSLPQKTVNKEETQQTQEQLSLPTKHTVAAGEDLWKISEKYYKTGYNWVDIAKENNLINPSAIEEGMELTIPVVTPIVPQINEAVTAIAMPTQIVAQEIPQVTPVQAKSTEQQLGAITGNSYTVVRGDNLWEIAVRAYGDGFRWVDIARVNKLANPNLIHAGNVFTLPR